MNSKKTFLFFVLTSLLFITGCNNLKFIPQSVLTTGGYVQSIGSDNLQDCATKAYNFEKDNYKIICNPCECVNINATLKHCESLCTMES